MAVRLDGQVALVTGAGRGLGRAYAMDLAKHGAKVIVNDFGGSVSGEGSTVAGQEVVNEIKAAGGEAVANPGDVGNYDDCYAMVKQSMDTWGRLDAIVCNAGILRDLALHNMAENDWDLVIRVHLKQCYNLIHHAWPVFRQQAYGRVGHGDLDVGPHRQLRPGELRRGEGRHVRPHERRQDRGREVQHQRQPDLAWRRHAHDEQPRRRSEPGCRRARDRDGPGARRPGGDVPVLAAVQGKRRLHQRVGRLYSRLAIVRNQGISFDPHEHKDADWFETHWAEITDLTGATAPWSFRETREQHYAAKSAAN